MLFDSSLNIPNLVKVSNVVDIEEGSSQRQGDEDLDAVSLPGSRVGSETDAEKRT